MTDQTDQNSKAPRKLSPQPPPPRTRKQPDAIRVRGASVNNLRSIDVDVPLGSFTAITGLSGSGKSSLAMGVLYSEGSARYLEALSTYTRRRLHQAARPKVGSIDYCPPALALSQRPAVPGPRSTVGTMSSVLAVVRLMFSRLGTHLCPNGHAVAATYGAAVSPDQTCPVCNAHFIIPSAEDFSFNGAGGCPSCDGLGVEREIDPATLVPDPEMTIQEGAVQPWRSLMRSNMPTVVQELGVRIDVPWKDLSDHEREIVLHGPEVAKRVTLPTKSKRALTFNVKYINAYESVRQMQGEGGGTQAARFLSEHVCSTCHGSRYSAKALGSTLTGLNIAQITDLAIDQLLPQLQQTVSGAAPDIEPLARTLWDEAHRALIPLQTLGLGYLSLSRGGATLSTGERQRIALNRIAFSNTTGLLLVLDEPTVGLHPDNVAGLVQLFQGLVNDGNTLVVVDHDVQVLRAADHLIEIGPGAGKNGGQVVATGSAAQIEANPASVIAPFLRATVPERVRPEQAPAAASFTIEVDGYLNLRDVKAQFPLNRLTVVTGASGAGKSALIIDSLVPALTAHFAGQALPPQIKALNTQKLSAVYAVDSTPIGRNARSTLATYSGGFDAIRKLFAATPEAKARRWNASHFSYNTKQGQCPTCEGTGEFALDLQYLPELPMRCPTCDGKRYNKIVEEVTWQGKSITDVMAMNVEEAAQFFAAQKAIGPTFQAICDVGLGYVLVGEATPNLSGGEAQRLRLAEPIHKPQHGAVYVFDEPSIGLHPADVRTLMRVLDQLMAQGATVIAVDHDLDLIANADEVLEMGPGAGAKGGKIIATGTPAALSANPASRIGGWLRAR